MFSSGKRFGAHVSAAKRYSREKENPTSTEADHDRGRIARQEMSKKSPEVASIKHIDPPPPPCLVALTAQGVACHWPSEEIAAARRAIQAVCRAPSPFLLSWTVMVFGSVTNHGMFQTPVLPRRLVVVCVCARLGDGGVCDRSPTKSSSRNHGNGIPIAFSSGYGQSSGRHGPWQRVRA